MKIDNCSVLLLLLLLLCKYKKFKILKFTVFVCAVLNLRFQGVHTSYLRGQSLQVRRFEDAILIERRATALPR